MEPYVFHSPCFEGEGRATVLGELVDGVLKFSVALCNPKDRFVKKIGREIAKSRLEKKEYVASLKVRGKCNVNTFILAAKAVAEAVIENGVDVKVGLIDERKLSISSLFSDTHIKCSDDEGYAFFILE